jgi:hypothetical protein
MMDNTDAPWPAVAWWIPGDITGSHLRCSSHTCLRTKVAFSELVAGARERILGRSLDAAVF